MNKDGSRYLATSEGRPVYLFTADEGKTSACYDACAEAWPPVMVEYMDEMMTDAGLDATMLNTIEREDGTLQVTYNGHPLYYFVQDEGMDEPQGQEIESFGGEWHLVSPKGEEVATK